MKNILINTNSNGYSTEQCGSTLTVKELIQILEDLDEDSPVYFSNNGGYTYGKIRYEDIFESEQEDEQ